MRLIQRIKHSSQLASLRQYWWNFFVNGFLMSYIVPIGMRRAILNGIGASVKGVIHGHCTILTSKLRISENSFINRNCFIDNNASIIVGKNCSIGYNVVFITTNHAMDSKDRRGGEN